MIFKVYGLNNLYLKVIKIQRFINEWLVFGFMKEKISLDEIAKCVFIFGGTAEDLKVFENEEKLSYILPYVKRSVFTPQERKLFGSTEEFGKGYYTPAGITEDKKSIKFMEQARQIVGYFSGGKGLCVDKDGNPPDTNEKFVLFKLAPLDPKTGETKYDPVPKDKNLIVKPDEQKRLHYRNLTPNNL